MQEAFVYYFKTSDSVLRDALHQYTVGYIISLRAELWIVISSLSSPSQAPKVKEIIRNVGWKTITQLIQFSRIPLI